MAKNTENLNLSDVQEMIAKMLAEAKAEAAKIVEEAKKATTTKNGMTPEEMAAHKAKMSEKVTIKLFKDNGKYKDAVPVGVNGEIRRIPRGEMVEIERKFAEVLDNSEHQDYEAAELISRKASEWEKANQ
jgi:hypothetical protein